MWVRLFWSGVLFSSGVILLWQRLDAVDIAGRCCRFVLDDNEDGTANNRDCENGFEDYRFGHAFLLSAFGLYKQPMGGRGL
tara:strand:+ start:131 stop:373 length:243 start_codon:yes stop_codon:yes gene_type:complete